MNNIQSILENHNVRYETAGHEHVRQGWIGLDCPWCRESGRFHLGVNLERGYANCWQCGPHRLVDVLVELTGEPRSVCLELLEAAGTAPRAAVEARRTGGRLIMPKGVEALSGPHRRYLRGRGFDPDELARLWGLKGIGLAARLSWRLWIPIHLQGETVSWTTRTIGENQKRYVSASAAEEKVPAKSVLYGLDYVRHAAVICEGPTDVWRFGPGAVATLGLGYSRAQLLAMSRIPVRVVCFDMERAAQRRAHGLTDTLSAFAGETYAVELETGDDPAGADPKEIGTIRGMFLNVGNKQIPRLQ